MNSNELAQQLAVETQEFQRRPSHWQFVHYEVPMACLIDEPHDRMRIIAAIGDADDLDEETKDALLEANFHTALDARYATSNGVLFAAFIHPLGSLSSSLLRSVIDQIASLVHTFGSHYTGGTLEFVGGKDDEEDEDDIASDMDGARLTGFAIDEEPTELN